MAALFAPFVFALIAQQQFTVAQIEQLPILTVQRDLRVDALAEDLAPINGLRVGPQGRILIMQLQDFRFVVFDSLGRRLNNVGSRGEGPGELMRLNANSFGWIGDTVWVFDQGSSEISRFTASGRYLSRVKYPRSIFKNAGDGGLSYLSALLPSALLADGSFFTSGSHQARAPQDVRWCPSSDCYIVATPTGILRNIVASTPPRQNTIVWRAPDGSNVVSAGVPFAHTTLGEVSANGGALAFLQTASTNRTGGMVRVTALRPTGDTLYDRLIGFRGIPVPAAAADSAVNIRLAGFRTQGSPVTADYASKARGMVPPVRQPYRSLLIGTDNTIWISWQPTDSTQSHLVIDPSGTPLGTVTLPASVMVLEVGRGRAWGTEADRDGVQHVVRYRIGR